MFKDIKIDEMRGMFAASQIPKFSVIDSPDGFLLVFQGCALLTFRGERRYFQSFDSVLQFVKRHFVSVYLRPSGVETIVSFDVINS